MLQRVKLVCGLIIVVLLCQYHVAFAATMLSSTRPTISHDAIIKKFNSMNIQAIEVGDTFRIVVPLSLLFFADSPRLLPQAQEPLDTIATYLKGYRKIDVQVAAYTDNSLPLKRSFALTQQQAQYVAEYLWARGIDARLQSAVGYGPHHPIASNTTDMGRITNRRIEITFRRAPD